MQTGNKELQKKRQRQRLTAVVLALAALLALVLVKKLYIDRTGLFGDWKRDLSGPYKVVRVVDGDTIVVSISGQDSKVRLIGVDTPESVAPETSGKENTEEGEEASEYVKKLLEGASVYLEYDISTSDQYGRLLAYVYLEDGKTMLQEKLLSDGMATVLTYQPNVKYADRFLRLQKQARSSGKGFWAR